MSRKVFLSILLSFLFLGMTNQCLADLSAQLEQALECKKTGNYSQADAIYHDIITNHPDSSYASEAKISARRMYKDIITNHPESHYAIRAKISLARAYKQLERYSEAEVLFKEVLASDVHPNRLIEVNRYLAKTYIAADRDSDAKAVVDRVKADFRDHVDLPNCLNGIARSYQRYGKNEDAKRLYQYIDTEYAGCFPAFLAHKKLVALGAATEIGPAARSAADELVGKFPMGEYKYDKVLPDINEVLEDIDGLLTNYSGYPYLPGIVYMIAWQYNVRASALEVEGLTNEAQAFYQKAASVFDVFVEKFSGSTGQFSHLAGYAYDYAGYCHYELGDYQKSINSYQKLVDNCSQHPVAWNAVAMIARNYEKMEEAGLISAPEAKSNIKSAYEQLITKYPNCKAARMASNRLSKNSSK